MAGEDPKTDQDAEGRAASGLKNMIRGDEHSGSRKGWAFLSMLRPKARNQGVLERESKRRFREDRRQKLEDLRQRKQIKKQRERKSEDTAKLLKIREEKMADLALKNENRSFHSRRATRAGAKMKSGAVRKKYLPLEPFTPDRGIELPEGFTPHSGEDRNGIWQLDFLKRQGLKPTHSMLDIGCGDLREGVPLVRYLDPDLYVGIDQNPLVMSQGALSFSDEDWAKRPRLFLGGDFGVETLEQKFDFVWANSVFSHVDLSLIGKCMASVRASLTPSGVFLATFFQFKGAPSDDLWLTPGKYRESKDRGPNVSKHTYSFRNPFHNDPEIMVFMASRIGLSARLLEDAHFKGQTIVELRASSPGPS